MSESDSSNNHEEEQDMARNDVQVSRNDDGSVNVRGRGVEIEGLEIGGMTAGRVVIGGQEIDLSDEKN